MWLTPICFSNHTQVGHCIDGVTARLDDSYVADVNAWYTGVLDQKAISLFLQSSAIQCPAKVIKSRKSAEVDVIALRRVIASLTFSTNSTSDAIDSYN